MSEELWDYDLPEELIAQFPLENRADSRLLLLDRITGEIQHRQFADVVEILQSGDLLVVNDTRVSAVRLLGHRATGGRVEVLLLREIRPHIFESLIRPAKKIKPGELLSLGDRLQARPLTIGEGGLAEIELLGPSIKEEVAKCGIAPLPPYIHQPLANRERYQTVYSTHPGSSAAPTAGLHFTPEILDRLKGKGVEFATVTLHVGLDTFRPLSGSVDDHVMHGEECEISEATAAAIASCEGRIVAVGTTTVRTLETFAVAPRRVEPGRKTSRIFIRPGYQFKIPDAMFTNFHMPRTTMLLMLSAFAGSESVRVAYREAVKERYRFLSFGDSMLII